MSQKAPWPGERKPTPRRSGSRRPSGLLPAMNPRRQFPSVQFKKRKSGQEVTITGVVTSVCDHPPGRQSRFRREDRKRQGQPDHRGPVAHQAGFGRHGARRDRQGNGDVDGLHQVAAGRARAGCEAAQLRRAWQEGVAGLGHRRDSGRLRPHTPRPGRDLELGARRSTAREIPCIMASGTKIRRSLCPTARI